MVVQSFSRLHRNGMVSIVINHQHSDGTWLVWSAPTGVDKGPLHMVSGPLEGAKRWADAHSGCPQVCSCPSWSVSNSRDEPHHTSFPAQRNRSGQVGLSR